MIGTSKGKGFQGVVKRHHFRGGAATHGSMFHRAPGSIGASGLPSRVLKGMRAAGHMGADRVTAEEPHGGARGRRQATSWSSRGRCPAAAAATWSSGSRRLKDANGREEEGGRQGQAEGARSASKKKDPHRGRGHRRRAAARAKRRGSRRRRAVDVVNASNEKVSDIALHPDVFGARVNEHLLYEAVKQYRAGGRRGTHMTKNRALVSGSGKKPWRQKGTGRARVGEIRNPLWRHGGTVFGPVPRDYSYYDAEEGARGRAALRPDASARSDGALQGRGPLRRSTEPKTKVLGGHPRQARRSTGKTLLVDHEPTDDLVLSGRNIPGLKVVDATPGERLRRARLPDAARLAGGPRPSWRSGSRRSNP